MNTEQYIKDARKVLKIEADTLFALEKNLDESAFIGAVETVLNSTGRVVVVGMGKSGHIGRKIAASLASLGTPSFFVHPGEAAHGDLGMILPEDVVLALSYSGESSEVTKILNAIKHKGSKIIAITGNTQSTLAKKADVVLHTQVDREACPLNLAPTTSTTVALAMGDALAVVLSRAKNFTKDDFAYSHPAGKLGKRLLTTVSDIMRSGDDLPVLPANTPMRQAILMMSQKKMGMVLIADENQRLLGIFTDGDLRRMFEKYDDVKGLVLSDVMSKKPKTVAPDILATDALAMMIRHKITSLAVLDSVSGSLLGAISLHDIQQEGLG
ncbi:MAG: KpsF/GutQ family sugar-phosphate isomerase [Neisseriaceae bacterium]|nr:KpsF/GutQ family sugar-phosphate isomerase [Neisseriaceae bacterium]